MLRNTQHTRSKLKWKLTSIFTLLIIAVALAVLLWIRISFEQYVKSAEISRYRSSVIALLSIEAKNYYTSRDDKSLNFALKEVKRINPDIRMVFISDEEGTVVGDDAGAAEKTIEKLNDNCAGKWNSAVDYDSNVDIGGEKYVLVSYKGELDPYAIHFGFNTDVIKARTRELSVKVSFVVGLTTAIAVLLGAAFLHTAIRPVEKLARDAEKLSLGDMEFRLERGSRSEVGRIYKSLARLKESILYSIKRLNVQ